MPYINFLKLKDGVITQHDDSLITTDSLRFQDLFLTGDLTVSGTSLFNDTVVFIGSTSGIDHGQLVGLLDDDHPQYLTRTDFTTYSGSMAASWVAADVVVLSTAEAYTDTVSGTLQAQITTYSDHGNLSGLTDDDHPQYLRTDGTRSLTGDWNAGDYNVTVGGDLTSSGTITAAGALSQILFNTTSGTIGVFGNTNLMELVDTTLTIHDDLVTEGSVTIQDSGSSIYFTEPTGTIGVLSDTDLFQISSGSDLGSHSSNFYTDVTAEFDGSVYLDGAVYFSGTTSGIDHGALEGLGDDDHTQYSLVDGTRDFTGIVSYDVAKTFTDAAEIVDKGYVDDLVSTTSGALSAEIITGDVATLALSYAYSDTISGSLHEEILTIKYTLSTTDFFLHGNASSVPGYETLSLSPSDDPEGYDEVVIDSGDGETLMDSYVTISGTPGVTTIPAGIWIMHLHAYIDSEIGNTFIRAKWYKRNTSGVETYLFTQEAELDTTGLEHYDSETTVSGIAMNVSDRLVVKMYAETSSGAPRTIRYYYEGTENYSYFHTPVITNLINDHGELLGLGDDDHTQYLNVARGDARYYTETELDGGQLDNRYYTETELNAGQLDNRYYTETEIDAFLSGISTAASGTSVDTTNFDRFLYTISGTSDVQEVLDEIDDRATEVVQSATEPENMYPGLVWLDTTSEPQGYYATISDLTTTSGILQAQIDTYSDHGNLNGLLDDDHTQYVLADGTRELSATWYFGSHTISGTGDIYCKDIYTASGTVYIGDAQLTADPAGDVYFSGGIHASNLYGDGSHLVNIAASSHNHDDRYYTETEVDTISGTLSIEIDSDVSIALSTAEAYTDSELATVSGILSAEIDIDVSTGVATAEAYTDSELATLSGTISAEIDTDVAAGVSTAESYTDSEISTLSGTLSAEIDTDVAAGLATAEAYTDSEVTTLSGALQTEIDAVFPDATTTYMYYAGVDNRPTATPYAKMTYNSFDNDYNVFQVIMEGPTVTGVLFNCGQYKATDTYWVVLGGYTGFDLAQYTNIVIDPDDLYIQIGGNTKLKLDIVGGFDVTTVGDTDYVYLKFTDDTEGGAYAQFMMPGPTQLMKLDTNGVQLTSGATVTDITTTIDTESPDDDTLATEAAINTFVTTQLASYYTQAQVNTISGTLSAEIDSDITTALTDYYTSAELDGGQLDNRYYTESEINAFDFATSTELTTVSGSLQTEIDGKSDVGHTHDDIYYTETELDNGQLDSRYYTETEIDNFDFATSVELTTTSGVLQSQIDTKIGTAGVTYEALSANSDIGTGSTQVSQGDHSHAYSAITGTHGNEDHSSTFITDVVNDTTPQLGGSLDLNGKCIDYGAVLTSSGTYEGDTLTVTVDTNSIGFGCVLAQAADFHYDDADADAAANSAGLVIAVESGTGSKKVLLEGQICNTAWDWSAGFLYLSTTSGEMTQAAPSGSGDQIVVVGWALSADTIFFRPSLVLAEHV